MNVDKCIDNLQMLVSDESYKLKTIYLNINDFNKVKRKKVKFNKCNVYFFDGYFILSSEGRELKVISY